MSMEIETAEPFDRFSVVNMQIIENRAMSWRARMILIYLQSRPPGWKTSAELLATQGTEGRDAIRTSLKELEEFGYIERIKFQNDRGHWNTKLRVHQYPITGKGGRTDTKDPSPEDPAGDTNDDVTPATGNPSSVDQPAADFQSSDTRPSVNQSSLTNTQNYYSGVNTENGAAGAASSSTTPPPSSSSSPEPGTSPAHTSREIQYPEDFVRRGYWPTGDTFETTMLIKGRANLITSITNYRIYLKKHPQQARNREWVDERWLKWIGDDANTLALEYERRADEARMQQYGSAPEPPKKKKFNPNAVAE